MDQDQNHDQDPAHRLHHLFMDLVVTAGLLRVEHAMPGHAVSLSQAFALHELDTDVPLSQQDLARRLRLDKSTVSRMAAEMQRKGLLVRERDPANRRIYRLCLTDQGRELHAQLGEIFHQQYDRWLTAINADELAALLTGLPALIRAMHDDVVPWNDEAAPVTTCPPPPSKRSSSRTTDPVGRR